MSGPKGAEYELERRRREELARQAEEERRRREEERRRKEEERRREEERQRKEALVHIGSIKNSLKGMIPGVETMRSRAFYMSSYQDVSATLKGMDALLERLSEESKPWTNLSLPAVKQKEKELERVAADVTRQISFYRKEYEAWEAQLSDKLNEQVAEIFSTIAAEQQQKKESVKKETEEDLQKQESLRQQAEEWQVRLAEYASSVPAQSAAGMEVQRVSRAFENLVEKGDFGGAAAYFGMQKKSLEKLVDAQKKETEQFMGAFTEQRIRYESVCDLAGVEPRQFQPETDYTPEMIQWMKEESIRIESEYLQEQEQQMIQDAIRDVMEEMGYTVLANKETVRRNGSQMKESVFSFDEGTGINVIERNGQITMEVVGLDTSDREPDEEEMDFMEEKMESFCDTYKKAEELLKQRGIVVAKRIQMLPPSREYAQILNVNDYETKTQNISMIQSRSRNTRAGRATEARRRNID